MPALSALSLMSVGIFNMYFISVRLVASSASLIASICSFWVHCCVMRAGFRAGVATFQCSDAVVFVFVFAIPVCLDPCDPVDCGYSVPPCNSEPVWRNDLVSRMQMKQENPAVGSLTGQTLNKLLQMWICSHLKVQKPKTLIVNFIPRITSVLH